MLTIVPRAMLSPSRSRQAKSTAANFLKVRFDPYHFVMFSRRFLFQHDKARIRTNSLSITAEDNMNVQLKDITVTARDGRVSHLDQVYIRGSHVRFFIVPDMLRYVSSSNISSHYFS
jgi:hypothetical protein